MNLTPPLSPQFVQLQSQIGSIHLALCIYAIGTNKQYMRLDAYLWLL